MLFFLRFGRVAVVFSVGGDIAAKVFFCCSRQVGVQN